MGRNNRPKYYGVRIGEEGPRVYRSWPECEQAVKGFPGALHKSFPSEEEALRWVFEWEIDDMASLGSINSSQCIVIEDEDEDELRPLRDTVSSRSPSPTSGAGNSNIPIIELLDSDESQDFFAQTQDFIPLSPSSDENEEAEVELEPAVELSDEQEEILRRVLRGESLFFTGSAGTGKSVLLREIIGQLRNARRGVFVTASTGIAATNIGGTTLHSFAGIGLGKERVDILVRKIGKGPAYGRWMEAETLIIDEVSMIDGGLFDKLEELARRLRKTPTPFGGIQLVLCGDFCQLPPVPDRQDGKTIPTTFAFDAKSWDACIPAPVILTKVFRQKEQRFIDILNSLRLGDVDVEATAELRALERPIHYDDGIEPTELYPLRYDVEHANSLRMKDLKGPAYTFHAEDIPGYDLRGNKLTKTQAESLLARTVAPQELSLKKGAQVMLTKNQSSTGMGVSLVNGSRGVVLDFLTFDEARKQHLETTQSEAKDRPPRVQVGHPHGKWPLVQFAKGGKLLCVPAEFQVVNHTGEAEATRFQVPLILAWALSVHKSQGQTIDRVKIDLGRTFEKGQAYVALSRATSLDTLQVLNFSPNKVMAHPRVIEWQTECFKEIVCSKKRSRDDINYLSDEEETDNRSATKTFFKSSLPEY